MGKKTKTFAPKMHKFNSTWRRGDGWLMANRKRMKGLSYRALWLKEGAPGDFEAWLIAKGVTVTK